MNLTASISGELAELLASKPITPTDRRAAAGFLLDAMANMVAGANSDPGRVLLSWARSWGIVTDAGHLTGDPGRKAFLLGALCHILEVDDLHRQSVVHPGCAVAPVVWAVPPAPAQPAHLGDDALDAMLWGFEACTRVGMGVGEAHYRTFHNTATCGPFGSAVAAGRLLGVSQDALVDAIGNAGTQAAGLWEFNATGAMTKHLHAGRAAEAGVVAAALAHHGLTGAPKIIEGERGFLAGLAPQGRASAMLAEPNAPWQVHATSIKPWPSCRHTHPAIEAAIAIRQSMSECGVSHHDIADVQVGSYPAAISLCDRPAPQTTYQAKFSLQHCVAAALALDRVTFAAFDVTAIKALDLDRSRVALSTSAQIAEAYPERWGADVRVVCADGSQFMETRAVALGDPEAPLSDDALSAKAHMLLRHGGMTSDRADDLIASIWATADGHQLPAMPELRCHPN